MKHPDFLILYVEDTAVTAAFFAQLFEAPIVEQSTNFAMVALPGSHGVGGTMLGLWARHDVTPAPTAGVSGFELGVTTESKALTDQALTQARALGARIVQEPVTLDFGYTFVLASPDGHYVRVFTPS